MNKPIKSSDSRKPAIVAALKKASNCRKVTCVVEAGPLSYAGYCMWPNAGESREGLVEVSREDVEAVVVGWSR